jgi:hypothetical protein
MVFNQDIVFKLNQLYELKQIICSKFESFTNSDLNFIIIERYLSVLSKKINIYKWLIDIARIYISSENEQNYWRNDRNLQFFKNLNYGFKKAKSIHFKNLLEKLDDRYNFQEENGFVHMYDTLIDTNEIIMISDETIREINILKRNSIKYPKNFIFWDVNELIKYADIFIRLNINILTISHNIIKMREQAISLRDQIKFISDSPDSLIIAKQVANLNYYKKLNCILFKDVPNISYLLNLHVDINNICSIINLVIANYRFQKYKEELLMIAQYPDRNFNWCLDEEDKKRISSRFSK